MSDKKEEQFDQVEVVVPSELRKRLGQLNDEVVNFRVDDGKISLIKANDSRKRKYQINLSTLILSILVTAISFGFFQNLKLVQIQMTGTDSMATMLATAGVISGLISFLWAFWRHNNRMEKTVIRLITLAVSFLLILEFAVILVSKTAETIFPKASFDLLTTILMIFLFSSAFNSALWSLGQKLSVRRLIRILSIVIFVGTFSSMLLNGTEYWYQNNFSFLGTSEAVMRWQFNLTLIVSSFLLMILINTLFAFLHKTYKKMWRLNVLQIILLLTALNLGAVGAFPYSKNIFGEIHNFVAQSLVLLLLVMIIGVHWLLPIRNVIFERFSVFIAVGLGLTVLLYYGIPYLSLTAFELFAFVFAFWWLLQLLNVLLDSLENSKSYQLKIIAKSKSEDQVTG